jgi:polyferredoxin
MSAGTSRRERRDLDRQQRRAAANRRIGHEMAWWYYWETPIKTVTTAAVLGVGGWLLWTRVDHRHIAAAVAAVGAVVLFGRGCRRRRGT